MRRVSGPAPPRHKRLSAGGVGTKHGAGAPGLAHAALADAELGEDDADDARPPVQGRGGHARFERTGPFDCGNLKDDDPDRPWRAWRCLGSSWVCGRRRRGGSPGMLPARPTLSSRAPAAPPRGGQPRSAALRRCQRVSAQNDFVDCMYAWGEESEHTSS